MLDRTTIIEALRAALEPMEGVLAMWEGGSAAFGEVDAFSDVDLQLIAEDDRVEAAVAAAVGALEGLSPLTARFELPAPTWHGHWQGFFQLADASPYLMVDLVVMARSSPQRFLEAEIHGERRALFDKAGLLEAEPFDWAALDGHIAARRATIRASWPLFRLLARKEIARGRTIEAVSFYHGFILRPLVELLRMRHGPTRFNFHSRRIYADLPPDIIARLEPLFLVGSLDALAARLDEAEAWVEALLKDEG